MERNRILGILIAAGVSFGLFAATTAQAAVSNRSVVVSAPASSVGESRNETVSFADLDLNLSSDERTLDSRIAAAAKRVCEGVADKKCVRQAHKSASAQVARAISSMN